jgi:hypothetical protein
MIESACIALLVMQLFYLDSRDLGDRWINGLMD